MGISAISYPTIKLASLCMLTTLCLESLITFSFSSSILTLFLIETCAPQESSMWQEGAKISPCAVPLLLRRPWSLTICHCVYTHQLGNCNLRNVSYRGRLLWALTVRIGLTRIPSSSSRRLEISQRSTGCTKTFYASLQLCVWNAYKSRVNPLL